MAAFVYAGQRNKRLQWNGDGQPAEKYLRSSAAQVLDPVKANDTIYVPYRLLEDFTQDFLPSITTDFVLISTAWQDGGRPVPNFTAIVEHPNLLSWFAGDLGWYTGGLQYHRKVAPFPLGLKPAMPGARVQYRNPVPHLRAVFMETGTAPLNKTRTVYAGSIRITNTKRAAIPSAKFVPYRGYVKELRKSHYVISPDGDHPDCHRHYEAIAMGAVPITELDPVLYRHLREGPVIFNNTDWNMSRLEKLPTDVVANRNMVFEEY